MLLLALFLFAGFLSTLANNVPMMAMVKDMDDRGKVLNFAFATCAAFTLGDHLGYCSAVAPEWILPMVCGKMVGRILAVALAFILPGMGRKKSAARPST